MNSSSPTSSPQNSPVILFVDDEEKTRKHFRRLFQNRFRIVDAADGIEALRVFQTEMEDIGVIVTDQRMPNETGTEFLQKAALLKPSVIRILSTAYADVDAAIDSVNKSGIYRYITKPWEVPDLEVTLTRAIELYELQEERDELQRQKMSSLQNLAATERIHSLAALSVFQNAGLRHASRALQVLVQLADQPEIGSPSPLGETPQWDIVYAQHRHFLEVAQALLPSDLTTGPDLDFSKLTKAAPLLKNACDSDPRFQWSETNSPTVNWPGPETLSGPIITRLLKGIGSILSQANTISAQETDNGIELSVSALSLCHGLQPLIVPQFPDGPEKTRCLNLTSAFLEWAHHGGNIEILPDHANRTITLRLSLASPGNVDDPWETLAADLVANDLFWHRHLG